MRELLDVLGVGTRLVFYGTKSGKSNGDRICLADVHELLSGEDLADHVWIDKHFSEYGKVQGITYVIIGTIYEYARTTIDHDYSFTDIVYVGQIDALNAQYLEQPAYYGSRDCTPRICKNRDIALAYIRFKFLADLNVVDNDLSKIQITAPSAVVIRKSLLEDKEAIQRLLRSCFGASVLDNGLKDLPGRYWLYFRYGGLVAMTGLTEDSEFGSLEVDWTCTDVKYRHMGIMQALFKKMLTDVDEPVYCSCWRLPAKDKPNLYTVMSLFGFKEVVHARVHWKVPYNCQECATDCICRNSDNCECYEDLYLRDVVR